MNSITRVRGDKYQGTLHVGQIVHCGLYGGMNGYISKIDGTQSPHTIQQACGIVMGGQANITVHFERGHDSVVPEAIIRGVQWEIGPEPVSDEVIAECLIRSAEIDIAYNESVKRKASDKQAEIIFRQNELIELPRQYPYLETVQDYEQRTGKKYGSRVCAVQNIKKELARNFPGIKFSVKGSVFSGGDSIDVTWTDGPTMKEVDHIVDKYNDHATDYTGDYRDPTNCTFNKLYGGAKYVSTNHHMSDETYAAIKPWVEEQYMNQTIWALKSCSRENLAYKLLSTQSIPAGHKVTGVQRTGATAGCGIEDFYRITTEEVI